MQLISQRELRILHVDDDPSFTDLTGTFLEREDDRFSVETATSADEGLAIISDRPPDCVVSDYNMPGMDGLEFLRAVRETHPDLPFVLFTGKGSEEVASDAIAAGVTDYIQKGGGSEQYELLANRIENAVRSRREAERADRQEELMRLTEFAGDTGGFEVDIDTGEVIRTDGARRILNLPEQANPDFETMLQQYHPDDRENIRQTVQRAIQTGEQTQGTWRYQHTDGEEKLLDITYTPVTANGDTTTVRGAIHDITDRRERQRELRQLRQAIDNANVPITLADPAREDDPLVYVNDGFEEMTGYPPEETLGRNCRFLQGEDTDPEKVATLREAIDNEETISVELRNYRKDGTEFWNRLTVSPIYDDDGELVRYLGTQEDVTARKERERELEAERQFIEQALDTLDDLFYVVDTDGQFQRWNEQVLNSTGYTEAELAQLDNFELFPEDERDAVADATRACLTDGKSTVKTDIRTKDGERIPYELRGARLTDSTGETTGIVGIGRDLTERRQRERRFQALVENSSDIISIVDADGVLQYQSPSVERILGYSPEKAIGETIWESVHPDDRGDVIEAFERWIDNPTADSIVEYRVRDADGSWRWLESRGNDQLDNPAVEGYVINSRDITERKKREQELQDITSQYEALVDNFPGGGVFLLDEDMHFVRAGGDSLADIGLSSADFEGNTPHDLYPGQTADEQVHYLQRTFDGESHTYRQEFQGGHYELRTMPIRDETGEVIYAMAVSREITQQVEQKDEIQRQNERLKEFTGIVSHDLQGPLDVAQGHIELAGATEENEHLAQAADAIERGQALVEDLLTLAREGDQVDETESVRITELARSSWQTVETAQATLETGESGVIEADRSRLQELLENLYRNAVEHGGDEVTVSVGQLSNGFYVADTGPGIPEAKRETVFEAGYSTKTAGTGFGLRIADQIAKAHGWEPAVTESEHGGARFEFTGVKVVN